MSADLLYSDVEDALRASVRSLVAGRLSAHDVASAYDEAVDFAGLWGDLSRQLGVAGLLVDERHDGGGATMREACVVAEEMGRSLAPVPFLTSAVMSAVLLGELGLEGLLSELVDGRVFAPALPWTARDINRSTVTISGDGALTGDASSVAGVVGEGVLLVPARGDDQEWALVAVDVESVDARPVVAMDMSRPLVDITFTGVRGNVVASGPDVMVAVARALEAGAVALASEQLGASEACLELTLEHVKSRFQFGRPIGSFQSMKHRIADVWLDLNLAGSAARYAADCAARDDADLAVAVAMAQSYVSEVAVRTAEECLQFHGGLGMTWEHPVHLYLKRAVSNRVALGSPRHHREDLAALLHLSL